jgi:hypothetical protein
MYESDYHKQISNFLANNEILKMQEKNFRQIALTKISQSSAKDNKHKSVHINPKILTISGLVKIHKPNTAITPDEMHQLTNFQNTVSILKSFTPRAMIIKNTIYY